MQEITVPETVTSLVLIIMEFKQEELVERELEIANYLTRDFSLSSIAAETGLNKRIVTAHIRNMMKKLKVIDIDELRKLLEQKGL